MFNRLFITAITFSSALALALASPVQERADAVVLAGAPGTSLSPLESDAPRAGARGESGGPVAYAYL